MPASVSLSDLTSRAQAGDETAFEALYREHVGRVFALCLRLSGDRTRAVELTQDVFVRCWEKLKSFRGESAFSTWLHRLAVNVVWMANAATSAGRRGSNRWRIRRCSRRGPGHRTWD